MLIAFLVFHLAGNLLVFAGEKTFNTYSSVLGGQALFVTTLELVLLAIFLVHIYKTVRNFGANRAARPVPYHKKVGAGGPSRKSPASSTMIVTGSILLLFVVLHLKHFKFGGAHEHPRGLYGLEMETFANPLMVIFYIISLVIIGFHLSHGFWSAFQSLGVTNARTTPKLVLLSRVLAAIIAGGFMAIPIWAFFMGGR
jgi:succinate dehydrogenase / fumarate reductase cytochrome b subunit